MSDCPDNAPLGNSISVLSGFPFPSAQFTEGIGKPLIRIRDLIGSRTETNFVGDFDRAFLIRHNDVLIGMDGDFNVVRWKGPEALLNQRVCKVSSASDEVDERFLFWWLKPHIQIVHRRTPQTTVRHLSVGDVYRIPKPALVSKAQAFAAAVLDTVDEAIAKTEAVIAKLRQVRAGLLNDLLTRGLNRNGQLRDPIAHPEQFQDSPLGQIPKEWTAPTLAQMCSHIGSGVTPRGGQDVYTSAGIMLIRSQNVTFDGLLLDDVAFIPEEIHLGMLRSEVFAHDVLFNITGASIGRCCPMPKGLGTANVNQHVCALRVPKATNADAKYLASLLASPIGQRQMDSLLTVGNRQGLNYQQLGSFLISWPGEDEREAISSKIYGIEDQISAEEQEHGKLALLKSGLMTDLLTGRVRVPL